MHVNVNGWQVAFACDLVAERLLRYSWLLRGNCKSARIGLLPNKLGAAFFGYVLRFDLLCFALAC